jgi:hypothetical protein
MILNDDYEFNRDAPAQVKSAFKFSPQRVLLKPPEKLYRILTPAGVAEVKAKAGRDNVKADPNEVGAWWMTGKIFDQIIKTSNLYGHNLAEIVRSRMAISTDFSPTMNALCIVELKRDMYAFEGLAAPQLFNQKDPNFILIGNGEQVWIPRMSWKDVHVVRFLNSFDPINVADLGPHLTVTLGDLLRAKSGG